MSLRTASSCGTVTHMTTTRTPDTIVNALTAAMNGDDYDVPPTHAPRVAHTIPDDAEDVTITDRFARCTWRGIAVNVWVSDGKALVSLVKGERVQRDVLDHTPSLRPDFGEYLADAISTIA